MWHIKACIGSLGSHACVSALSHLEWTWTICVMVWTGDGFSPSVKLVTTGCGNSDYTENCCNCYQAINIQYIFFLRFRA